MHDIRECEATVRKMWAYLDGVCDPAEHERVAAHLRVCIACAGHFAFAAELLRAVAKAPVFSHVEPELRTRVLGALAAQGFHAPANVRPSEAP
ncbi:MAG: zf-HC2 domain-containing protein [Gemmatimonadaceae bacterium]|nr:zf-HC2 domain-containing protein [Gemmatimonadaceae bacterium]